jgi:hypothetical protein
MDHVYQFGGVDLKYNIKMDTTNSLWDVNWFQTTLCVSVMNKTMKTQVCLDYVGEEMTIGQVFRDLFYSAM